MSVDMVVPVPTEVPGEDVAFPPYAPITAASVLARLAGITPTAWEDLTVEEAIDELRKDAASIYHADFADDPTVMVDCPNCGPVSIDASGICTWNRDCGYDFARFGGPILHVA